VLTDLALAEGINFKHRSKNYGEVLQRLAVKEGIVQYADKEIFLEADAKLKELGEELIIRDAVQLEADAEGKGIPGEVVKEVYDKYSSSTARVHQTNYTHCTMSEIMSIRNLNQHVITCSRMNVIVHVSYFTMHFYRIWNLLHVP
jgi:hypothetical protein